MDVAVTVLAYSVGYILLVTVLIFAAYRFSKGRARKILKICLIGLLPAAAIVLLLASGTL